MDMGSYIANLLNSSGKSSCFIYNWIQRIDYDKITDENAENFNQSCIPACECVENRMLQMTTSPDFSEKINYSFRVEASFTDLEIASDY
ncbi:unnamed protein product [Strongylus vulgaris]|uniref:Uncharacterized protein n=1 Tax=Strongylus vulgaris TaxID=40348 RepID=A0A3P7JQL0_STRVU|nr:unnamed protein product [Strongylus vulgaris]